MTLPDSDPLRSPLESWSLFLLNLELSKVYRFWEDMGIWDMCRVLFVEFKHHLGSEKSSYSMHTGDMSNWAFMSPQDSLPNPCRMSSYYLSGRKLNQVNNKYLSHALIMQFNNERLLFYESFKRWSVDWRNVDPLLEFNFRLWAHCFHSGFRGLRGGLPIVVQIVKCFRSKYRSSSCKCNTNPDTSSSASALVHISHFQTAMEYRTGHRGIAFSRKNLHLHWNNLNWRRL